jgi:NAD(P)H-dependent FMN reductase
MTIHPKLLFLSGSTREASHNKRLAKLGHQIAEANGIAASFLDLWDYPMPLYDGDLEAKEGPPGNAQRLKAQLTQHHGIFIASPEYNAGVTPILKNAIDWISRVRAENEAPLQVFRTRVFALGSASPGGFGGMRGLLMLRQVLAVGVGALVIPEQISIPRADSAFDSQGHLADKGQQEGLKALIQRLAVVASAMAQPR